jgi:cytochrome c oxidase subunit 2
MSRLRLGAGLVVAIVLVSGCLPAPASSQARAISELWTAFVVAAAVVGGVVWGLITIALVRFRRRAREAQIPPQFADARRLEIAWTAIPIAIVIGLFWLTLGALGRIEARAPGALEVDVAAFRWQWRFDYPASGVSVTGLPDAPAEMVVPVGEPIHIVLGSSDVIHSFYVPAFLFKRDTIPGRTTEFDLTIAEPGAYGGQCAEFCGVFHDRMTLTVRAVSPAEFEAWLAARRGAGASLPRPSGSGAPVAGPSASAP